MLISCLLDRRPPLEFNLILTKNDESPANTDKGQKITDQQAITPIDGNQSYNDKMRDYSCCKMISRKDLTWNIEEKVPC